MDAADAPAEALVALRQARDVDPHDEEVDVFVVTLLSESAPEAEAMAAVEALAERRKVDLASLRRELTEADMPVDARTLLMNGFLRARGFVRSRLEDSIERSRRARDPEAWAREIESERRDCEEMQKELQSCIDPDRVPMEFRDATPWAIRLGVGDDVCRSALMQRLSPEERSALSGAIQDRGTAIHAWLDHLEGEGMSDEAAAFMNLLLAMEETDPGPT